MAYDHKRAAPYRELITGAARQHGVRPELLAALLSAESNFNPQARSPAGALGIAQFMPPTAAELGVDPFNPASAISGAAQYLAQQIKRFGDERLGLAAYNAGPGNVRKHGGVPPFKETQDYVQKVLALAGAAQPRLGPLTSSGPRPPSPRTPWPQRPLEQDMGRPEGRFTPTQIQMMMAILPYLFRR